VNKDEYIERHRLAGSPWNGVIFSRLDTIHKLDRQTDRQTYPGRQQRPRLRIASNGKNMSPCSLGEMLNRFSKFLPQWYFNNWN